MPRAPFQVLVLPYRRTDSGFEFALFRRADGDSWQPIAGGGEDAETPLDAARREASEEAGLSRDSLFMKLDTFASVPVTSFRAEHSRRWGDNVFVIPEYSFGVRADGQEIRLSSEHTAVRWLAIDEAGSLAKFDSNRIALWELNRKLLGLKPRD